MKLAGQGFKLETEYFSLTVTLHSRPCSTRRLGQILAITLPLLLGMMVLAWGTGYKVSLYKVKPEANTSAPVKLCTRSSDVAKSDVDSATSHHEAVQAPLVFALLSFSESEPQTIRALSSRTDFVLVPPSLYLIPSVDRRPPPSELRLLHA